LIWSKRAAGRDATLRSMKKPLVSTLAGCLLAFAALAAPAADGARQAEVARRGADVMPFSLAATTHVFTRTGDGGSQRVVAKDSADAAQVRLVRQHLRQLEAQFRKGDFSGPAHIHGNDMPGLAGLRAARPGEVAIAYREVDGGAVLTYRSANPALVAALHQWFDAQLSDHGADAMAGHDHQHGEHRH
jgi:hypothetical protein